MNQASEVKKLSCYAVLRTGLSGENYLISHMRLVLLLIYKKKYSIIEAQNVMRDFYNEYHYKIDYFPMLKILSLATVKGYLKKNHNSKRYVYTETISEFSNVENDIKKSEKDHQSLIREFINFCQAKKVVYSYNEAEEIVISYINAQKLEHITGHIKTSTDDKRIDYLFGLFIYNLKTSNPPLFEYMNSMVIGAILADCLVFHEMMENGRQLEGLTIVLDTPLVFIALGIDIAGRSEYYCNLLRSLKSKGATLTMFEHSYNEMQQILLGTKDWVSNYNYDPSKASATTAYFRSIGATRTDVEEFSISLRNRINDLGIQIIDVGYEKGNYPYQIDENQLSEMIVDYYQKVNPSFNKDCQQGTIDLDVKSITLLYFLRKDQKPMLIPDAKYLFITTNKALSKVASDYHNLDQSREHSLPPALTDVFLGTYLWLSDLVQISKMNEQQIISHAFLAFQPNDELLEKLVNSVNELQSKGVITSEVCYMMRSSRLVSEKLAEKTLGNPDAFTDATSLEILQEIREESANEARKEMQDKLEEQKIQAHEEKVQMQEQHKTETDSLKSQLDILLRNSLEAKNKSLKELKLKKEKGTKSRRRWKRAIIIFGIVLLLLLIVSIITCVIWKEKDWYSPTISLVCTILPIAIAIIGFLYGIATEKTMKPQEIIKKFLDIKEENKLKKLKYSKTEYDDLNREIQEIESKLQKNAA